MSSSFPDEQVFEGSTGTGKFSLAKRDLELFNETHPVYVCYHISFSGDTAIVSADKKKIFEFTTSDITRSQWYFIRTIAGASRTIEILKKHQVKSVSELKEFLP